MGRHCYRTDHFYFSYEVTENGDRELFLRVRNKPVRDEHLRQNYGSPLQLSSHDWSNPHWYSGMPFEVKDVLSALEQAANNSDRDSILAEFTITLDLLCFDQDFGRSLISE